MHYIFWCLIVTVTLTLANDAPYVVIGLNEDGETIDQCTFPCFESNCSATALQAYACPKCKWIAFVPDSTKCMPFNKTQDPIRDYVVWGVDKDRQLIPQTVKWIDKYFYEAVNYGCAVLRWYPEAMWFGMLPQMGKVTVFVPERIMEELGD